VAGRETCRYHGGTSNGRPIVHGRYSTRLPRILGQFYAEALEDVGELANLSETLALRETLLRRSAQRVEELDTPGFRDTAVQLFETCRSAGSPQELAASLSALGAHLKRGASEDAALRDFGYQVEEMARRQEKVWDLRMKGATAISARDLVAILARFASIVTEEAPRELALAVCGRIDRELLGGGLAGTRPEARSP
jgi:energy-converting hydrogenase Eha subunit G